jgi:HEAT repeat protein
VQKLARPESFISHAPLRFYLSVKRRCAQQPDVASLVDQADVEGLVEAARFQDVRHDSEGRVTDRGMQVRERAILALGEFGADAGNGTVIAALRDPIDLVRSAAVRVLYARGEGEALGDALGWLPASQGHSRKLASRALLELRSTPAARAAVRAVVRARADAPLSDADIVFVRALIQPDRRHRPAKGVIRDLLDALADERAEVADRAEELLIRLAPMSTSGVIGELETGSSPERAAAILGRIGDPTAMPPLILALEHRESDVRVQAAGALGALRHPGAVQPLLRATRDGDLDVRVEASHALDRMGAAVVIAELPALLGSMINDAVASALERPTPAARKPTASTPVV